MIIFVSLIANDGQVIRRGTRTKMYLIRKGEEGIANTRIDRASRNQDGLVPLANVTADSATMQESTHIRLIAADEEFFRSSAITRSWRLP